MQQEELNQGPELNNMKQLPQNRLKNKVNETSYACAKHWPLITSMSIHRSTQKLWGKLHSAPLEQI